VGENLLLNGTFDAEQVDFPEFWSRGSAKAVFFERTGGPEGKKAAVTLRGSGAGSGAANARQQGLTLVPGGTYKLSAFVRTRRFASRNAGVIVHNSGWLKDVGLKDLPADSAWTYREKTFTLFPSKNNEYGVALFAVAPTGEVSFADVRLEALSEEARKGSASQMALVKEPRLVPVEPLLNRIPEQKPELTVRFFGVLPEKIEAYACMASVDDGRFAPQMVPLQPGGMTFNFSGVPRGDHTVRFVLRNRFAPEESPVIEVAYPITIVNVPEIKLPVRTLNNLVSELLDRSAEGGAGPQSFAFANPRDGWVFVAVAADAPQPDLRVMIDDRDAVITAATACSEAFRELPMGEHRLCVSGAAAGARVRVRSVPEIFDYPPCADSKVRENGPYDWAFMKRHVLSAVTTLNGGALPGSALGEAKALGLKWLANFGVAPVDSATNVQARLERHAGLTQPQYDGLTSDELFFGRVSSDNYTKALWRVRNPEHRLIYTWVVGKPSIAALHTDFLSACLNASKGRGRLLFEAYCHPQADESSAAAYLDDMLDETMRRFNAFFPNAAEGTGMIFGNFNQIPIISLESDPGVDFKYFLDMQVNRVANSPAFKGVATVGYWGTYYGDEELARWSFMLMRHYAVEGRREMLSARYGFRYRPGLLANGDFAEGLKGWTAEPAAAGSIRAGTLPGYGKNSQGRWGAGAAGDTVCVLARQAAGTNRVVQTAQGLAVGKAYCLQFVTADRRDVLAHNRRPRRHGIDVELPGVTPIVGKSFVHVDARRAERGADDGGGQINLHRIVFRAVSPAQVVAFSDAKAQPGEEFVLNFVQLKPYFE